MTPSVKNISEWVGADVDARRRAAATLANAMGASILYGVHWDMGMQDVQPLPDGRVLRDTFYESPEDMQAHRDAERYLERRENPISVLSEGNRLTMGDLQPLDLEVASEGVKLRPLQPADAHQFFDHIRSDPLHHSMFGDKTAQLYRSVADVRQSIEAPMPKNELTFGVWVDGRMVGSVNLVPRLEWKTALVGYWIGKSFIRKGYATKALRAFSEFATDSLGYDKLEAIVAMKNQASIRVLKNCGYEPQEQMVQLLDDDNTGQVTVTCQVFTRHNLGK